MPHIPLPEGVPGPRGPMLFRPEVAPPMSELAEVLMRGPSTLTLAERELIGTYVSAQNDCRYCQTIHGAVAAHYLGATEEQEKLVQQIKSDPSTAPISAKLKALLNIAAHVQQGGKQVTAEDIAEARRQGASDLEIHDTVLIAANFCMMNRYVDGLATWTPDDPEFYRQRAAGLANVWLRRFSLPKLVILFWIHLAGFIGDMLLAAPQEQADHYGSKCHASQINDKARLIETRAIIPVSDRNGTCRAAYGIRCPRQSIQNGKMPSAKVMREQIRHDIGFAPQTYTQHCGSHHHRGECMCESEHQGAQLLKAIRRMSECAGVRSGQ